VESGHAERSIKANDCPEATLLEDAMAGRQVLLVSKAQHQGTQTHSSEMGGHHAWAAAVSVAMAWGSTVIYDQEQL
jgi:hypothetical protein